MRKRLTLATLLLSFTIGPDVLFACGDKFFLVGRGDRFSRAYATLHPSARGYATRACTSSSPVPATTW